MRATEFDEPVFLTRLRTGDAVAYGLLVRRFHASLVRVAASIIGSQAQAEEVVQDSWIAVHASVGRFEGRSSLVTWIFSIVLNRARTRVSREGRLVGLDQVTEGSGERAVPLARFRPDGHWAEAPRLWDELNPERVVAGRQLWAHVQTVIAALPAGQRAVILLRDLEGRDAAETCALLEISAENQRVLLHRARARIREAIDRLVGETPAAQDLALGRAGAVPRRKPRDGVAFWAYPFWAYPFWAYPFWAYAFWIHAFRALARGMTWVTIANDARGPLRRSFSMSGGPISGV